MSIIYYYRVSSKRNFQHQAREFIKYIDKHCEDYIEEDDYIYDCTVAGDWREIKDYPYFLDERVLIARYATVAVELRTTSDFCNYRRYRSEYTFKEIKLGVNNLGRM